MTKLLLSSCGGDTWAIEVRYDARLREVLAGEIFSTSELDETEQAEVRNVAEALESEVTWNYEDGGFELRSGGVKDPMYRQAATLFDAIKHGDDAHQAWLKDAIAKHFKTELS